MELEAVSGEGLRGQEGAGSRLARGVYLCRWIEQLSACHLADRLMRTLSHSAQWGEGHTASLPPLYHPPLIVKPAKIFPSQCAGDRLSFFFSLQLSLFCVFTTFFFNSLCFPSFLSSVVSNRQSWPHSLILSSSVSFYLDPALCPFFFFPAGVQV